jgi:hypothetical protein
VCWKWLSDTEIGPGKLEREMAAARCGVKGKMVVSGRRRKAGWLLRLMKYEDSMLREWQGGEVQVDD